MMIGLISDTHMPLRWKQLPPIVFDKFADVDLIIHSGDVGELWVLDQLSEIAPVVAVHGNDETPEAQAALPFLQTVFIHGQRIVITHGHYPDRDEEMRKRAIDDWNPKMSRWASFANQHDAQIVIYGHTHIPMCKRHDGVWLINPGAIASGGMGMRQTLQTIARLDFADDGTPQVEHIDINNPDNTQVPVFDWDAGFKAVHNQVSESLMQPELEANWQWLREEIYPIAMAEVFEAFLPMAHECWIGERDYISVEDIVRVAEKHELTQVLEKFKENETFRQYIGT